MKVRTNLNAKELSLVAKGLMKASKSPRKKYSPENSAEHTLLDEVNEALDTALEGIQTEFLAILKED